MHKAHAHQQGLILVQLQTRQAFGHTCVLSITLKIKVHLKALDVLVAVKPLPEAVRCCVHSLGLAGSIYYCG